MDYHSFMKKIFLIKGNSVCGKSSTAQKLKAELGTSVLLLQQDEIRKHMLDEKEVANNQAISLMGSLIAWGEHHVDYIILEGILKKSLYQTMLDQLKNRFTDKMLTFYFNVSFEESWQRNLLKEHPFSKAVLQNWWQDHDELGYEDKIFQADENLDQKITDMINYAKISG